MQQDTPDACVEDVTPPTFAGIATLTQEQTGALTAGWLAATDLTAPITYEVYVQAATATGLFALTPQCTKALSLTIYEDSLGNLLEYQVMYYVGVRARDGVGNIETNVVTLNATSNGVIAGQIKYECFMGLAVDPTNMLLGELYLHGDGKAVTTQLGTASVRFYDSNQAEILSLAQTGLTANADGVYAMTPVSAAPIDPFTFYRAKITITHNSVPITSYVEVQRGE
jgi:hypothetical protein